MTYAEIIYICADLSKSMVSDDSFLTEDHIKFLVNKHRTQLLYEKYKDIKKQIPYNNYQTVYLELEEASIFEGNHCVNGDYLASKMEMPHLMTIGNTTVYPMDYYNTNIIFIPRDRMKYIGYNKYLQNIIYCSQGSDDKLYFKSANPQHKYLKRVKVTGLFEDIEKAAIMSYELKKKIEEYEKLEDKTGVESPDNFFNYTFPLEEELVPTLIQMVIQELTGAAYKPKDSENNATDDLSDLIAWARRNMKSDAQKQIEG